MSIDADGFRLERDTALMSMSIDVIRALMNKYESYISDDITSFWVSVHKARTGATSLPLEERAMSKTWLQARGYKSWDAGDVPAWAGSLPATWFDVGED